jgi:HEAT repeat protein
MSVKDIIHEYAQKRSQAASTKQYSQVLTILKEYVNALKTLSLSEKEIADEFNAIVDNPCRENTDLWIIAAQIYPSPEYLNSLCTILEREEPCIWHEGIVDILYDLEDERSIPSLEKALTYDKPSDPTRELAVKILETLDKIGSPKAREVLRNCLKSPSPEIRAAAEQLLSFDK